MRREEKESSAEAPKFASPLLPAASSKELAWGSLSSLLLTLELSCQVNLAQ